MMWKTLIFLAMASAVLAVKINSKRNANYAFHIKHDYEYLKHEKSEHHEQETDEKPAEVQEEVAEPQEEKKEEVQNEEVINEPEQSNESEVSQAEPEEPKKHEEKEYRGYEFYYKVLDPYTHDKKGQHEEKHGGEIKGVYWLLQPDGYKRTVDYYTDKHNGFHAKVDYSKSEKPSEEDEYPKAKSEQYVKTYRDSGKHIPVNEEHEEGPEEDKQEESAQHIPIYVI